MTNTVHAATDFQALTQGAALCAEFGGSFVLYVDGVADDSFDTLEAAADAYVDCWADFGSVSVVEFAPSGLSADVTQEARKAVEGWCHARFDAAPWEVAA